MYWFLYFIISLFAINEVVKSDNKASVKKNTYSYKVVYILIVLLLIAFAGFRGELGTDYVLYSRLYSGIKSSTITLKSIEPAYLIIGKLAPSFNYFLLICAALAVSIKGLYFYKYSEYTFVTLLIYYSFTFIQYDMGTIRQGIAIAITLSSIDYIEKKDKKQFLIRIVIAILFHYSAFIFLIAYPLSNIRIKKNNMYLISIVCVALAFTNFWRIIAFVLNSLSIFGLDKYSWYFMNEEYRATTFELMDLQRLCILIFFVCFISNSNPSRKETIFINLYFVSTVLYYSFRSFSALSNRGAFYFTMFDIFLFPCVLKRVRQPVFRLVAFVGVMAYCAIYVYQITHQYDDVPSYYNLPYIPYHTWLSD